MELATEKGDQEVRAAIEAWGAHYITPLDSAAAKVAAIAEQVKIAKVSACFRKDSSKLEVALQVHAGQLTIACWGRSKGS